MKRPQTEFHAHAMRESQVIRSKKKSKFIIKSKFILWSKVSFSCSTVVFFLIDILLKLQEQIMICFCKFSCNSVIIMGLLRFLT